VHMRLLAASLAFAAAPLVATEMVVNRLGPALGAEITGLDLSKPLDEATVTQIKQLIDEHLVLCFRGQSNLTPETQIAFTEHWGAVEPHPLGSRVELHPKGMPKEVMVSKNTRDHTAVRNDIWHTDLSCMSEPVGYSVLHALEVPPPGWGDTMFANTRMAWENLSPAWRTMVEPLTAVHNTMHFERASSRMENFTSSASSVHPVVRTHPRTGRDALYLAGNFIDHFEGMDYAESRPLLQQLIKHATSPHFVYRHRWHQHDVIMWDNRATMHYAVFDYEVGQPRTLHRTTAAGERPFRGKPVEQ